MNSSVSLRIPSYGEHHQQSGRLEGTLPPCRCSTRGLKRGRVPTRYVLAEVVALHLGVVAVVPGVEAGNGVTASLQQLEEIRFGATASLSLHDRGPARRRGKVFKKMALEQRAVRLLILVRSVIVH